MKFKSLFVLLLASIWGGASWWWYTCKIKGFCTSAQPMSATLAQSSTTPTALSITTAPADTSPASDDTQSQASLDESIDSDQDGLPDTVERKLGLDPKAMDSDQDGLTDIFELPDPAKPQDTDKDGTIDALDHDDDGDGEPTLDEDADPNKDGDPSDARDSNKDGKPDYLDPNSSSANNDDDNDGVSNGEEQIFGTNPALADSDADSVPDRTEVNQNPNDTDQDGVIDALDNDDDGDGIPTAEENPDPNNDGKVDDAQDSDKNGVPDYLQAQQKNPAISTSSAITNAIPDATQPLPPLDTQNDVYLDGSTAADKAKQETEQKAKDEADKKAKDEADKKAKDEADKKAKDEADKKAKDEADKKAKDEADKKAKDEADKKAKDEADKKAKDEADKKAKDEADKKAKDEADKKAKDEADKKAKDEAFARLAREEADKKAKDEAFARLAREEADKKAKADAERKAKEDAANDDKMDVDRAPGGQNTLQGAQLYFPSSSTQLTFANKTADYFDEVARYLKKHPKTKIKLVGHTDNKGTSRGNQRLGMERAEIVRQQLEKRGVMAEQIKVESVGETQPIGDNNTDSGRKQNRRVELIPLH